MVGCGEWVGCEHGTPLSCLYRKWIKHKFECSSSSVRNVVTYLTIAYNSHEIRWAATWRVVAAITMCACVTPFYCPKQTHAVASVIQVTGLNKGAGSQCLCSLRAVQRSVHSKRQSAQESRKLSEPVHHYAGKQIFSNLFYFTGGSINNLHEIFMYAFILYAYWKIIYIWCYRTLAEKVMKYI
jgi:hypothetical protein